MSIPAHADNSSHPSGGADATLLLCPPTCLAATRRCVRNVTRHIQGGLGRDTVGGRQETDQMTDRYTDEDDAAGCCCCCCCCPAAVTGCVSNAVRHVTDRCCCFSDNTHAANSESESRCHTPRCKWWKRACTRIYLVIVNLDSFLGGWALIALAIWVHINRESLYYWPLFWDNPTNPAIVFDQVPIILAIVGLLFAVMSFLGCCGACTDSICFLGFYTVFLTCVIAAELAVGVLAAASNQQISDSMRLSMRYQIQRQYNITARPANLSTPDTVKLTQSWDQLQTKFNCCGADGPQDYVHSAWFNHTPDDSGIFVPNSCCREVLRRSHYGINENFCQVHAMLYPTNLNESHYLNTQGCYHALTQWTDNHIQLVVGWPLSLVILTQIISLVLACALIKWVRRKHKDYWWYPTEECE